MSLEKSEAVHRWFSGNRKKSEVGLVTSYPDEPTLRDQGFTYDLALSGIVFAKHGDTDAARALFKFFKSSWDGQGFWTVYNSLKAGGAPLEYAKVIGPSAWVGLFLLAYHARTNDAAAVDLALAVAGWGRTLPHKDGGVAMGADLPWKNIYSVENNLDYYALLKGLRGKAGSADKAWIEPELDALRKWFKEKAYDPVSGLFRRAPQDITHALDTNAWSVLTFGPQEIHDFFSIDVNELLKRTEKTFAVQSGGGFGGEALTARGFDFSGKHNAVSAGRKSIKWLEGTNQMIAAYSVLKDFYSNPAGDGQDDAAHYEARADYFLERNDDQKILCADCVSFPYTDSPGAKIWWDNPTWTATPGSSAAATAWVYFALERVNPFQA